MSISTIKHNEPLFVVIFRDARANALLKEWVAQSQVTHAQVQEHRLQLFNHHGLSMFMLTWKNGWGNILIWDSWNKRHLDIQNS